MASILRIGCSDENLLHQLREALALFLPAAAGTTTSGMLEINNKYFDAHVSLELLRPLQVESSTTTAGTFSVASEDGILLVFDDSSKEAFDTLGALHASAEASGHNGDLLRLCVGVTCSTTNHIMTKKEQEEEYSRRVLWCLDRGYEYVEKVDLTESGIQQGHEAREKEGFARLVEAIQGTVWSSAKMHTKTKQQLKQSYLETQQSLDPNHQSHKSDCKCEEIQHENDNQYEPPSSMISTISDHEAKEREEKARTALLEQDGINSTSNNDNENLDEKIMYLDGSVASKEEREREQKADKMFSAMDNALKEANRIREMSRAGQLSDEDRKKRAGDAATLLMNIMNQMGGLESDSEESGNDDDAS